MAAHAHHGAETVVRGEAPKVSADMNVTPLIDVLLVLLSLAASADHRVVFRNSAYAAATLMIRLALTAPPYLNVAIAVGAALYALLVSMAYERARVAPLVGVVALEARPGV